MAVLLRFVSGDHWLLTEIKRHITHHIKLIKEGETQMNLKEGFHRLSLCNKIELNKL